MSDPDSAIENFAALLAQREIALAQAVRDGRRMRAERGRLAVVDATLKLINEGKIPTFAEVAEKAGISERTAFRYFPDRESLFAAVAVEVIQLIWPHVALEKPDGTVQQRVALLVENRMALAKKGGPFARIVDSAPKSTMTDSFQGARRSRLHEQLLSWLSPELDSLDKSAPYVIGELLTYTAIENLQKTYSDNEVAEILQATILHLLNADPKTRS